MRVYLWYACVGIQKYSSYAVGCCIPCNSVRYERKLYIMSSNVKTNFRHLFECKSNMQYKSMNIIFAWFTSHCSNILVHLCIVYSSRISQNIFCQIYFTNYLTWILMLNVLRQIYSLLCCVLTSCPMSNFDSF